MIHVLEFLPPMWETRIQCPVTDPWFQLQPQPCYYHCSHLGRKPVNAHCLWLSGTKIKEREREKERERGREKIARKKKSFHINSYRRLGLIVLQLFLTGGRGGGRGGRQKPRLNLCLLFSLVLSQAENWQRLYNDTRSLFPVVLEQLDDYNAKLSDLQESLDQALNNIRDAEDMNRATAARQRDHQVE